MRYSSFGQQVRKNLTAENSQPRGGPSIRSTWKILWKIVALCCLLFIISLFCGIFFGDAIISLKPFNDLAIIKEDEALWLPLLIFLTVLLLLGWGIAISLGGITSYLMKGTTTGEILCSELRSYYDSDEGDVYYIVSSVAYLVQGYQYRHEGWHSFFSPDLTEAKKKLEGFKPGDQVTIIYDPKNPYSMTLDRQDTDTIGEILAGIGFIAGGLLMAVFLGLLLS